MLCILENRKKKHQEMCYRKKLSLGMYNRVTSEYKKSPPDGRHKKRTWQLAIVASSHYRRRYDA